MQQICEKDLCTGCYACYNACEYDAIKFVEDGPFGHLYPKINEAKCTNCNKCSNVCPINHPIIGKTIPECFAAKAKDTSKFPNSSSGGIASLLIENCIKNKGIAYCAIFNKNLELVHTRITSKKQIYKASGSKYVQSNIGKTYQNIKNDLNNKKVLFIGTPCQVAGLLSYIGPKNKNLTTVDFVCHGVPSQKMLYEQIDEIGNSKDVNNILFRDKNEPFPYYFKLEYDNKNIFKQNGNLNPYIYFFLKGLSLRSSCYKCQFAHTKRVTDITIGDFWGLPKSSVFYNKRQTGISLLLINTKNGRKSICSIHNHIIMEEQDIKIAINANDQLNHPTEWHTKFESFISNYNKLKNLNIVLSKTFRLRYIKNLIMSK